MRILNKTRNTVLAENVEIAGSPFKRMKGLLGRKELRKGEALVLMPCNSVHTFFMKFPIDILFVDKLSRVVKTKICLSSFRLSRIYFRSHFAIELPAGTIPATFTQEGDEISLG